MLNAVYTVDQKDGHQLEKPIDTEKLNFGQLILTLNTVKQFQGQKDGALSIDKRVANIPCTEKSDFVRKWIESHEESRMSKRTETSPIFSKRRKRVRKKNCLNDTVMDNSDRMRSNMLQSSIKNEIFSPSIEHSKRIRIDGSNSKENIKKNLFNVPTMTARLETSDVNALPVLDKRKRPRNCENGNLQEKVLEGIENTPTKFFSVVREVYGQKKSPILAKNSYYKKRRWRKPAKETLCPTFFDEVQYSYVDSNMNSIASHDLMDNLSLETKFEIMCTQKQQKLMKKLEDSLKENDLKSFTSNDSKISKDLSESNSAASNAKLSIENVKDTMDMETDSSDQNDAKLHIEDSPKDVRDTVKIETESSNLNDDNSNNDIVITVSDTDTDLSDQIEDTDVQDVDSTTTDNSNRKPKPNFYLIPSKADSVCLQMSSKKFDQTFCEKAEQLRCANVQCSQKISQVSTQINDLSDRKSSQSGIVISTETSSDKTYPNQSVQLNLLDSGKKRKKPKRGSLSERLQLALNRQISFVRVWRYQLKQIDKDNISVPCVTVYIQACVTRYSKQFLEGMVIEDSLSLLSSKERSDSSKLIKIMTIPSIVGKVEMKSSGMVQIFPPWQVLDDKKLILHVTYIRVVPDNEKIIEENKINTDSVKEMKIKEFGCPCVNANRMIPSCTDRCNKPNVIKQLFTV